MKKISRIFHKLIHSTEYAVTVVLWLKFQQLAVFLLYCLKADWSFKMNQHCHVTSESVLSFHCRESPMAFSHYDCTILFSRSMHCNFFSKISYAKVSDLLYVGNIHFLFVC